MRSTRKGRYQVIRREHFGSRLRQKRGLTSRFLRLGCAFLSPRRIDYGILLRRWLGGRILGRCQPIGLVFDFSSVKGSFAAFFGCRSLAADFSSSDDAVIDFDSGDSLMIGFFVSDCLPVNFFRADGSGLERFEGDGSVVKLFQDNGSVFNVLSSDNSLIDGLECAGLTDERMVDELS